MSRAFLVSTLVLAVAAVATEIAIAVRFWPDHWETAQQATLAAGLVTASSGLVTTYLKAVFDELTARAEHARNVKAKILERFLENRARYLEQLGALAGELATSLDAIATHKDDPGHLEFAFYRTARYVELVAALRSRFQRLVPPDHMPGFILRSSEAEHRVWALLPEPWAFGYHTPTEQAALLEALRRPVGEKGERELVSARDFTAARRSRWTTEGSGLRQAWNSFRKVMAEPVRARGIAHVLRVLNNLLTYEMADVLEDWYGRRPEYPTDQIQRMLTFFEEQTRLELADLGVVAPPLRV